MEGLYALSQLLTVISADATDNDRLYELQSYPLNVRDLIAFIICQLYQWHIATYYGGDF